MILACFCRSAFQDERYGVGKRVFNHCQGKRPEDYRCSVCGRVMSISRAESKADAAAARASKGKDKDKSGEKKGGRK